MAEVLCISLGHKKNVLSFLHMATGAVDLKLQVMCWFLLTLNPEEIK